MKNKKIYLISIILLILIAATLFFIFNNKKSNEENDNKVFASEYGITEDNVYVYKALEEINKILENGTGLVYLGFPECPWCRGYVPIINEVAKEQGLDKIYYFNIKKDREDNSKLYQKTVELLSDNLRYDNEGNRRIYAPSLIAVKNGKVVMFDDTRYWNNKEYDSAEDFWNNEDLTSMKEKLVKMINEVKEKSYCEVDCN